MEYTIVNGELYHFGVKGMKWGHRKRQVLDGLADMGAMAGLAGIYARKKGYGTKGVVSTQNSKKPGPVMGGPKSTKQSSMAKNAKKEVRESKETKRAKASVDYFNKELKALKGMDQNKAMVKANKFLNEKGLESAKRDYIKAKYKDEYRAGTSFVTQLIDEFVYKEGGANHYANQRYAAELQAARIEKKIKR